MPADTARATGAQNPNAKKTLTDEELADQAERQSALIVLRKVAPYLWPSDMPWVRKRVVWALIALLASKLVTVATPFFYAWAVDCLLYTSDAADE